MDALKKRYGVRKNTDVLRCVLAEARKARDGYVLPPLTEKE